MAVAAETGPVRVLLLDVPLILASASPRRVELLRQVGVEPTIEPADVDEEIDPAVDVSTSVLRLAREKARTVADRHRGEAALVLGADTLVVVGGAALGKPTGPDDAAAMLTSLSGRSHQVLTAVAVVDAATGRSTDGIAVTTVRMRALDPAEILAYVATGEPLDKAGSYAIQGRAAVFVEGIEGDFTNVVGLPLPLVHRLVGELRR